MLPYGSWILTFASFCGLMQSLIFLALSIGGGLVYLCVIPVEPYSKPEDFYRVTLVKLYFEGPKCIPNGSYLGKFNEDYKNLDKISLITQDLVFAFMVAYAILHAVNLLLSLLFFCNRNADTKEGRNRLRDIVLGWSILSLVISLVDVLFTIEMVYDVFGLANYLSTEKDIGAATEKFSEIFFIPLALALTSSRVVVIWVWNVLFGLIFFCKIISCEKETTTTAATMTSSDELIEELKETTEEISTQKPTYRNHPEWNRFRYSMEAVTPFNEPQDPRWTNYPPSEPAWPPNRFRYERRRDEEGISNEGFVNDDQDEESSKSAKTKVSKKSAKPEDFDHNLKNFEPGKKKIKIVKGVVGKPVSIPVPPPLPAVESYTC